MSQSPPHRPDLPGDDAELLVDPTRDALGTETGDVTRDDTRDASGEDTGPAEAADLPADPPTGAGVDHGVPAYGTDFGVQEPPQHSWVPPRATTPGQPGAGAISASGPSAPGARTRPVRTVTIGGALGRALGGRVQTWHVVAAATGLLIPVGFALASSLGSDLEPIDRPVVGVTRNRPLVTPTFQAPSITLLPGRPSSTRKPGGAVVVPKPNSTTRPVMTAPPPVVPVPDVPVTPVPTDATTVRFEAYAEKGARIEVSLSDARHQRYEYPVQASPLAFETTIDRNVSSNDYLSLRVRVHDPTGSGARGSVSCRVVVDGVVIMIQQGRTYATCHLSPYYDIRRP